jgi:hypothetical protein
MVIALPNGRVNRIPRGGANRRETSILTICGGRLRNPFTPDSSQYLNCPSNLIGHDHFNKPANGERMIRQSVGGLAIRLCAFQ